MNNEELKKKIVEILEEGYTPIEYDDGDWGQTYFPTNEDVANALIAAGIGDVKEAEHRAEVAERALLSLCVDIQPYSLFDQTPLVTEASVKMQEYLKQAEKELAEENGGKKKV